MLKQLLLIIFISFTPFVVASDGIEKLHNFVSEVDSFNGIFKQTVYDEHGEVLQESMGKVALDKPGKFRWQYTEPFPQLILADGEYLWIYDEELLQATAKPIDEALGSAPIMLLTNVRPLEDDFEIMDAATRDGLLWVQLIPKIQDTEFNLIHIGLNDLTIEQMELHDQFSQKTVIEFSDLDLNKVFAPDYFRFNAPDGVDVVGYPENRQL